MKRDRGPQVLRKTRIVCWKKSDVSVGKRIHFLLFRDTVDKKRVNSCVQKYLFLGNSATKKIAPNPENAFSNAVLKSRCQQIVAGAAKEQLHSAQFCETALCTVH